MFEVSAGLHYCNTSVGERDEREEKWTKAGEARRVVGQERPEVLADGVLYYMYAKTETQCHT